MQLHIQVVLSAEDTGERSVGALLQSSYLSVCCKLFEKISV